MFKCCVTAFSPDSALNPHAAPARGLPSAPRAAGSPWLDAFAASHRDLLRFLRRRTGCSETARDLAQDAWLRVSQRHDGEAGAAVPATADHRRAYLFTVAERLAIDHLRRQDHWRGELVPRLLGGPAHAPDVAESHAYGQALRAVESALAALPERARAVFLAHRLEGAPHEALADRFGVSRKTIEREVTRAMDVAQAALQQGAAPARGAVHAEGAGAVGGRFAPAPGAARKGRRQALGALLGLAGCGSAALLSWQAWREWMPEWQTALATPTGRTARLLLPEGSALTLDVHSAAEVRLTARRREVHLLAGGAFFAVARDAERPFVVQAGAARVIVLGTRFEVRIEADGVRIAVESGRVRVEGARAAGSPVLQLEAGQAARVDGAGALLAEPAPATVASWRSGWLEFDRVPLGEVVARLNRYRAGGPVRIEPAAAALPVLARVDIASGQHWLRGLPAVLPVTVDTDRDGGLTIRRR